MTEKIHKTTIVVTVLSKGPLDFDSLGDLHEKIDTGPYLGNYAVKNDEILLPEKVKDECLELGNDGSFFGDDDSEE
jgi:hypothetical protein